MGNHCLPDWQKNPGEKLLDLGGQLAPVYAVRVEKLRSVMQRTQARDFYDIWYLLEIHEMDVAVYSINFRVNCESKEIDPTEFHKKLDQRLPQYIGRWKSSIADQIRDVPDFERVEREVMRHLKKLEL